MASNVTPIERLAERAIGVDPAAIEDEFARIWRETSGQDYDESSVRLRVLTFVAVCDDIEDAARFREVMDVVPRHHPCRGILALTSAEHGDVEASISARCFREPGGSLDVCSEEVLLAGGVAQQRELASAVLALLVPEIPVIGWLVAGTDPTSYLASEVMEAADVLLVDSGSVSPVGMALRRQLDAQDEHEIRVFDLAWGRTETWRALIAQFFDQDERLAELSRITSIEIRGHGGRASAEPMLAAGWLVSRLGLSLADLDGDEQTLRATLYDGTRGVRLTVGPGWAPDVMTNVRITTGGAEFEIQGHEVSQHLHLIERWATANGDETRRAVDQPSVDDASLVLLGLDGGPDPRIGREAVVAALALLGE